MANKLFRNTKIFRYKIRRNILNLGIAIFGILFALIAIMSFVFQYTGAFVISIDEASKHGISLCEESTFTYPTSYLRAKAKDNAWPVEYKEIDIDKVLSTNGNSDTKNYLGYTFYLKNVGQTIVDIQVQIQQLQSTNRIETCSRFMLLQDDRPIGVFKWEDDFVDVSDTTPTNLYKQYNDSIVYTYDIESLKVNETVKFSIIIWLEGWDKDCTNDKKGGTINYNMNIKIINYYEEEN